MWHVSFEVFNKTVEVSHLVPASPTPPPLFDQTSNINIKFSVSPPVRYGVCSCINRLGFVAETWCVSCEVRTGFLYNYLDEIQSLKG
jgi:hypothetical protein